LGLGRSAWCEIGATAPFLGAAIAIAAFHEPIPSGFWWSALLMAAGVALHLTERHAHEHRHEALRHAHSHVHDEHQAAIDDALRLRGFGTIRGV
jgi:hypothetical protein